MDDKQRQELRDKQRRKIDELKKETDLIVRNMHKAIKKANKYKEEGNEAGVMRMRKIAKDYEKRLKEIKEDMNVALVLFRALKD